jgi:uncharacterized membrane protein
MIDRSVLPPSVIPDVAEINTDDLKAALRLGWQDYRRAPAFGLAFSLVYVLRGLVLYSVFAASGQSWWFVPIAVGFPIFAPFAAAGLYEVSRRLERAEPLSWRAVFSCVWAQKERQVPSMSMVIMLAFMFWVFVAHTIFALFFGLQPITWSSMDMLMSGSGLMMLFVGGDSRRCDGVAFFMH